VFNYDKNKPQEHNLQGKQLGQSIHLSEVVPLCRYAAVPVRYNHVEWFQFVLLVLAVSLRQMSRALCKSATSFPPFWR